MRYVVHNLGVLQINGIYEVVTQSMHCDYPHSKIVYNKMNGVDVNKWDYYARDCHYLGVTSDFQWRYIYIYYSQLSWDNWFNLAMMYDTSTGGVCILAEL